MTTLRQQIARKRLRRSIAALATPAALGVALGVVWFIAFERSSPRATAVEASVRPARAAHAPSAPYRNCDTAHAAGAAPILRGEPGYGPHLDRDGDGVGCEPYPR